MNNGIIKILTIFLILVGLAKSINADELKPSDGHQLNFFSGVWDINNDLDKSSELFGIQHSNENLFRDTFLGKFSPVTGMFMTGKGATYIYTGIEAQYGIGPIKILPSFTPGFYEKGSGKDLGDVIEFKTELKFGVDIFKDSKIGYSYSHISNNDWGTTNPGSDNQSITFSKKF